MSEESKATASIHELTYDFACRITRLFQYLTEDAEYREYVQSKQIYRSGTSIGANIRESKHAQSVADFLSKMSIAYKEADETDFWLNLLHDNGYLDDKQFESLEHDIDLNTDKSLVTFVMQSGYTSLQEFVDDLEQTGFVSVEGSILRMIANKLDFVFSPDGNTYAADNNDGRLSRWILKNQQK